MIPGVLPPMKQTPFGFILFFLLAFPVGMQAGELRFHPFQDASYNGGIHSIAKDSTGRIWFSGADAVFMFDGNRFVQQNSLVTCQNPSTFWSFGHLAMDGKQQVFIATNRGLQKYNYSTRTFSRILPGNIGSLESTDDGMLWFIRDGIVTSLTPDEDVKEIPLPKELDPDPNFLMLTCSENTVWLASSQKLLRLCRERSAFDDFAEMPDVVADVLECNGKVYVLTQYAGLFCYSTDGRLLKNYRLPAEYGVEINAKQLFKASEEEIWAATQQGLFCIDIISGQNKLVRANPGRPWSLPNNSVWSVYRDRDKGIWIGTYGGKLALVTDGGSDADYFKADGSGLSHPIVSCFAEDSDGNLWIGTEGGGITVWNRRDDLFTNYNQQSQVGLNSNMIKSLRWESGGLVVCLYNGGLQRFDPGQKKFQNILSSKNIPRHIYSFEREGQRGIWLTDPDDWLLYYDFTLGRSVQASFLDSSRHSIRLKAEDVFRSANGHLMILTRTGLYETDSRRNVILHRHYIRDAGFAANNLCCKCVSSGGSIYFGTRGGGLNRLDGEGNYHSVTTNSDVSLEGIYIFGIEEQESTLWMSTSDGIYCYSEEKDSIWRSSVNEPSQCGAFYVRSSFKTSKGEVLFGGTDGFILFNPEHIAPNPYLPHVYFVNLKINDTPIAPEQLHSAQFSPLHLKHNQSSLEISFAADSYLNRENNSFVYRILGISDAWSELAKHQRLVRIFDLPPGSYRFEVKAANNDGIWGREVSSIAFDIAPSPFFTWWANCIYFLLLSSLVLLIWRFFTNRKIYQQQQALIRARIEFFTHISHDLKTPLSLIVDPLHQLRKQVIAGSEAETYASLIEQNVGRIRRMISQLLMFRQIESQKMTPDSRPGELVGFLHRLFALFGPYAEKKGFRMSFTAEPEQWYTHFDYEMIEKIFTNLLSNAVKYTPEGNEIILSFLSRESGVEVLVSNTGVEIDAITQEKIFKDFECVTGSPSDFESSTGLGLAIVRKLVDALDGSIQLESDDGKVTFKVLLPLRQGKAEEIPPDDNTYKFAATELKSLLRDLDHTMETHEKKSRKAHSVVIIDDHDELRKYLEMHLSHRYNVYSSSDGKSGVASVKKVLPQVVITDLKMSNLDGYQVCHQLREEEKTAHIPIIVLSGSTQDKVSALEAGANLFMEKPFDMAYLMSQVEVLIRTEDEYRRHYSKRFLVEPGKEKIEDADAALIAKAMELIEKNMDNNEYDVEDFVSDMGIGRTVLYQKLKAATGMPVKEFILDIRLRRAAQLLKDSNLTVSEISWSTGFSNPKYFSVCFKRRFDKTPTEYRG